MIRITPKINVSPEAISAYTPPVRMPKMTASRIRVISAPASSGEGGLGVLRLSDGGGWRVDRHGHAVLPLHEERRAVRPSDRVERDRTLHGLIGTGVQRRDQGRVGDAVRLLCGLVDDLTDAVGLGRVTGDVAGGAAVLCNVLTDEFGVARRVGA